MNIAGTEYDINYKALSIFISGCDGTCPGCHNQELLNFSIGNKWYDFDFHQINFLKFLLSNDFQKSL